MTLTAEIRYYRRPRKTIPAGLTARVISGREPKQLPVNLSAFWLYHRWEYYEYILERRRWRKYRRATDDELEAHMYLSRAGKKP